jgi:hypothetical protein
MIKELIILVFCLFLSVLITTNLLDYIENETSTSQRYPSRIW